MLNIYSCRSPLESSSVVWKSGEKVNLEELTNPVLVGYNSTGNFTVDVAVGIFRNVSNNIDSCFSWQIYRSITMKSNQLAEKKYWPSDFMKRQRGKILAWHNAVKKKKKMNHKHSQVLLVFGKSPRKLNYGWRSVLKTCTALIVGFFDWICSFDEAFVMSLTSTEQLFIERPLYRRFLHNHHWPYFQ